MIKSFRHKGLEKPYKTGSKAGVQAKHSAKLRRILGLLDVATKADDVNLDGLVKRQKRYLHCTEIQRVTTCPPSVARLFTTPTIFPATGCTL